ncbi:MAG: tetracycline regulation of excision, RteC, partial [Flavobacterium psychrophilum]
FSVELGNYARVFSEIRIRKSGQANFIDHIKEKYLEHVSGYR